MTTFSVKKAVSIVLCATLNVMTLVSQAPRASLSPSQLDQWTTTKTHLKAAADADEYNASYQLGLMYEFPQDGKSPDRAGAAYWYKRAADHGNLRGAYRLAIFYYDQGDDTTAYKYFEQAAQGGMPAGMFRFGEMLVRTNFRGNGQYYGLPWLRKAAEAGDPDAENELGRRAWQLYLHPDAGGSEHSAAEWFAKAASAGSCEGAMNLGGVYFNGLGVSQDATKADLAFRAAESCPGAPSWVREKASGFRHLIAEHKLPDPSLSKPAPLPAPLRVDSHESQMGMLVAGIIAFVGVAALLSSSNPSQAPSSTANDDPMDDFFAQQAKRNSDFWLGRSYCDMGWHMAAGTMGVWCP